MRNVPFQLLNLLQQPNSTLGQFKLLFTRSGILFLGSYLIRIHLQMQKGTIYCCNKLKGVILLTSFKTGLCRLTG